MHREKCRWTTKRSAKHEKKKSYKTLKMKLHRVLI